MTVSPDAESKTLEIAVDNCSKYTGTVVFNGREYPISGNGGQAEVEIDDIPTTKKTLSITLNASGYKEKIISVEVKRDEMSAPEFMVSFHKKDHGGRDIEITEENQPVETGETSGTLKISSPKVSMATLTIDGEAVTLTEGNNKNFTKEITGISAEKIITVAVTYKYYKPESRSFRLKKVEASELPLDLVSAKLWYGPWAIDKVKFEKSKGISFRNNEAAVKLGKKDVIFSTVLLEMEFDADLKSAEVTECSCGRSETYGSKKEDLDGRFAGHFNTDVNPNGTPEQKIIEKPFDGKKYMQHLIVGAGDAEFKIKAVAQNDKFQEYTIKITNECKDRHNSGIPQKGGDPVGVFNGYSFHGLGYNFGNAIWLPYCSKGPLIKDGKLNGGGFSDFAYTDKLALIFQNGNGEKASPFIFFYSEYDKNSNKGEFKRMLSGSAVGDKKYTLALPKLDPNGKCIDACLAFAETAPDILSPLFVGEEFRKIKKPAYNYLLSLENDVVVKDGEENVKASEAFGSAFSYRTQTRYNEENNKTGGTEKPLTIGKHQNYKFWTNDTDLPYTSLLSGSSEDGKKDKFIFSIVPGSKANLIKSVKHTIKKGDVLTTEVTDFKNVEPSEHQEEGKHTGGYILGTIKSDSSKVHNFVDGDKYKVEVEVEYNDSNTTDKFVYVFDYKSTSSAKTPAPEFLSTGDFDTDTDLFGVPIHFATVRLNMSQDRCVNVKELGEITPICEW